MENRDPNCIAGGSNRRRFRRPESQRSSIRPAPEMPYRSGLLRGLLLDLDLEITGRMASLAAAYAVEQVGTQAHYYTIDEFVDRFDRVVSRLCRSIDLRDNSLGISQPA